MAEQWKRKCQSATLRGICEVRGMTVDQLASGMGILRAYLNNIEDGRKRPTVLATKTPVVLQVALVRDEYFGREQAELESERRKAEAHLRALRTEA